MPYIQKQNYTNIHISNNINYNYLIFTIIFLLFIIIFYEKYINTKIKYI